MRVIAICICCLILFPNTILAEDVMAQTDYNEIWTGIECKFVVYMIEEGLTFVHIIFHGNEKLVRPTQVSVYIGDNTPSSVTRDDRYPTFDTILEVNSGYGWITPATGIQGFLKDNTKTFDPPPVRLNILVQPDSINDYFAFMFVVIDPKIKELRLRNINRILYEAGFR